MNTKKAFRVAVASLGLAMIAMSGASADTRWERHHPRRDEVVDRLHNQDLRIQDERREGELTARQAHYLHREDRAIFRQEQREARINGGYLTKGQQRQLNREENGVSGQIGR